ncbi:MAG: hypothetical protein CVU17_00680 [Betaproteobacteria bacterium HGW-Betaproteobacteria-11]|nr:MAG: hypothetical protein CVU17_00680 [Betaproteobacteria bacterium HGW-Betaproteobacteria-11]
MLTRCPACQTTFRVRPEQLRAQQGRVRCGQCQHAFNALDTLLEEPAGRRMPPEILVPTPRSDEFSEAATPDEGFASTPEAVPADEPPMPLAVAPAVTPETVAEAEAAAEPVAEGIPAEPGTENREAFLVPPPAAPRRLWLWAIGSVTAFLALVLQILIGGRTELAVRWPESRPALLALCDLAGCQVKLPARAELIGIEASNLHPDPRQTGRLEVSATLRNRAPFAQIWPNLELTLTDIADQAVARKVIAPADYLPAKTILAAGMPPNNDVDIHFSIVADDDMVANGYRLYLFYP